MTKEEAVSELSALITREPDFAVAIDMAINALNEPERTGKWIGYAGTIGAECSVCHKWLDVIQGTAEMNYCPNCGARMEDDT